MKITSIIASLFLILCFSGCENEDFYNNTKAYRSIINNQSNIIDLSEITSRNIVGVCLIDYVVDTKNISAYTSGIFSAKEVYHPPGDHEFTLLFWSDKSEKWQIVFKTHELAVDYQLKDYRTNNYCFKKHRLILKPLAIDVPYPLIINLL